MSPYSLSSDSGNHRVEAFKSVMNLMAEPFLIGD
jgi:hypothetical protein